MKKIQSNNIPSGLGIDWTSNFRIILLNSPDEVHSNYSHSHIPSGETGAERG